MKMTFEDYLVSIHAKQYIGPKGGVLEEGMLEDYERWIENIDVDDWFELGEEYKNETKKELNIIYDLMRDGQFMEARRRLGVLLGYEHNTK